MERPTTSSSRPSTSKGRPKTANQNGPRPASRRSVARPSFDGTDQQITMRPVSRRIVPDNEVHVRAIPPEPRDLSSSIGRMPSKAPGTSLGRPKTGVRIPTASQANRPVTKQGLSNPVPQSRMGTGMRNRLIMDKTYFKGLLRNKINLVEAEVEALRIKLEKGERDSQQLFIFEQQAEQLAKEIENLQKELQDYNIVMDKMNTNSDFNDLTFDVNENHRINSELSEALEKSFKEFQEKESDVVELEKQLELAKKHIADKMDQLDPNIKSRFAELAGLVEHKKQLLSEAQTLSKVLDKRKADMETASANSPLKLQAMVLNERLTEIKNKRNKLLDEINSNESPEAQRERLTDQVKNSNEQIHSMEKQIEETKDAINIAREEIREFENNFNDIAISSSKKYQELKIREHQIDEFLEMYDKEKAEYERKIKILNDNGLEILEKMSQNINNGKSVEVGVSIKESEIRNLKDSDKARYLQDKHQEMQEMLLTSADRVYELHNDIEQIQAEIDEITQAEESYVEHNTDFEREVDEFEETLTHMRQKLQDLQLQVPDKEAELLQITKENAEYVTMLAGLPEYRKLKQLEDRTKLINEQKSQLKEEVGKLELDTTFEDIKAAAILKKRKVNELLMQLYN
uniref:Intraflagellar transport protein 74 homolog n=1 Tax=Rhabditophanes sp. KR3021 TaxID=114890 RepID=A0AC35TJN5_9BILA